ncbi:MAG TPA: DnaB-like helicase N-terminal domain-containing protein, partial [Treponemataceae bacterium]|nr:DnaB-like helicase N-terminal domain-containing protein [Treponemataceae bacterium]
MQVSQGTDFTRLYSKDLEAGILIDFIMSDNDAAKSENAGDIDPSDFYFKNHADIFKIIKQQVIKTTGKVDTET